MTRALEESQKAIKVYPNNYVARNNAALYAMYAGDFPTAIKQAQTVLQSNPTYLKAYIAIALSQLGQNDINGATETYKKLAAVSPAGKSAATVGIASTGTLPVPGLDLMHRVKDQLDPEHRLSPGRFVGGI